MKKRVLSGAAVLGLLLLSAATLPQDPVAGEPVERQAAPPSFRDVLRGKVGQECDAAYEDGVWTLVFFPRPEGVNSRSRRVAVDLPGSGDTAPPEGRGMELLLEISKEIDGSIVPCGPSL